MTTPSLAQLRMEAKDASHTLWCDALTKHRIDTDQVILVASVAGSGTAIKAVRAALSTGKCTFRIQGTEAIGGHVEMGRYAGGYRFHVHKFASDVAHLVAVAKLPGLLPVYTADALFHELKTDRFTTPVLREWMPDLEAELKSRRLLSVATMHGITSGLLQATSDDLDACLAAIAPLAIA